MSDIEEKGRPTLLKLLKVMNQRRLKRDRELAQSLRKYKEALSGYVVDSHNPKFKALLSAIDELIKQLEGGRSF